MEKDILTEVIEVEKEIQRCLEEEKRKSREWVHSVRSELEEDISRERAEMRSLSEERLREACTQARTEAESVVKSEKERASLLALVPDSTLREIAVRHLHLILPK